VINATGPFSDTLRLKDDAHAQPLIAPSQGAHVVLPSRFLPGDSAIMVPHSDLGRVMFAIPWHDHVVVGTTDHPVREVVLEPRPLPEEVDFILGIAGDYLAHPASRSDVLSAWAGIRPLVSTRRGVHTMAISRDHHLEVSRSGLVTITGGKWTTYRMMAEDAVDQAAIVGGLSERACVTPELALHAPRYVDESGDGLAIYGSDATGVRVLGLENTALARRLHANLPITGAQAVWAAREEMARTVEDVLARRTRALFLDAESALAMAPDVAELLSRELGRDAAWRDEQLAEFRRVAQGFLVR
jgi:glycerol-3-phosphate dehydrogenase